MRPLAITQLAAGLAACIDSRPLTLEGAPGCYVLEWSEEAAEQPHLFPDSVELALQPYGPIQGRADSIAIHGFDSQRIRPMTPASDSAWNWKTIFADNTWWFVQEDTLHMLFSHDCAECIHLASYSLETGGPVPVPGRATIKKTTASARRVNGSPTQAAEGRRPVMRTTASRVR